MRNRLRFSVLGISILCSCGGPTPTLQKTPYKVPLKFSVSSSYFLNNNKQALYEQIRGGEPVPYGRITHALIEDHWNNWAERHRSEKPPALNQTILDVQNLSAQLPKGEAGSIKQALEAKLQEQHKGPLVYNASAISFIDTLRQGRLQAYSGSLLLHVVLRELWGAEKVQANHLVAIFESGHLLPGYLEKKQGEWHLTGIETAVAGRGRVVYGPVQKAVQERMLRLVDADLFALVELFKFDADDPVDLANQALKLTAEKYDLGEVPFLVSERFKRETDYAKLNWSPFNFGYPDVGQEDRPRAEFDERAREQLPRTNPNSTIFHTSDPSTKPNSATSDDEEDDDWITDPPYPYREVASPGSPDGKVFQCWHYGRLAWMTMRHKKKGRYYYIRRHPCKSSKKPYEPLPLPLKMAPRLRPTGISKPSPK